MIFKSSQTSSLFAGLQDEDKGKQTYYHERRSRQPSHTLSIKSVKGVPVEVFFCERDFHSLGFKYRGETFRVKLVGDGFSERRQHGQHCNTTLGFRSGRETWRLP